MTTQQLLQLQPCKQEQHVSQTMQSQTQQANAIVFPVMAWAGAAAGRQASSGDPALYDFHNNNYIGSDGSQLSHGHTATAAAAQTAADGDASWEVRAFAEDSASCSGQWPPRSYACSFCRREFRTAQALGGHMNVHRRERAQANNMAILRSTAQQAAAAATTAAAVATPQQLTAVAGPNGQTQWCLYSPMGTNPAAAIAATDSPERRAFFYSSLAPSGALLTMTSSSGGSSQFSSRSSPGPSPPSHSQYNNNNSKSAGIDNNHNSKGTGGMFVNSGVQISSSRIFPTSPMSSPASQGSRSSGSSVITKSGSAGSQDHEGGGGSPPYRSSRSVSGDSASFAQKLQLGAFQPYQSSPFAHEAAPLVTQELIQLRPQQLNSSIFSKSIGIRGPVDDVGILDLELRLGPA